MLAVVLAKHSLKQLIWLGPRSIFFAAIQNFNIVFSLCLSVQHKYEPATYMNMIHV